MKRIITVFTLSLLAVVAAWGERVVIFEGDNDIHLTVIPLTLHQDGVTLSLYGTVWPEGLHMYADHESSLSVVDGKIVQVVFEHQGSTTFTFSSGSYFVDGGNGLWAGNVSFLSFVPSNEVVVHRIIVTVEDNKAASPTISPSSGIYYNPIEVSISCRTPGATIHYTTDGTVPDMQSPVYTAPFTISQDTKVKAISTLDGEVSDIASAVYTIPNLPPFDRLEDLVPLDNDTQVRFTSPVYALAQHNKYLYVKDDSGGYALIWGNTDQTYNTGDVIPAGFVVTKSFYSGEMELMSPHVFQPASGNIPIEPETITPGQQGHDWFGHYVIIKNVHIINDDGKYVAVDALGNQIPIYFGTLGFPVPEDLSKPYDITGIIGSYGQQTIYRLLPTNVTPAGPEPTRIGLGNYRDYYDPVNPPESITIDYDATVILQTGPYLYAKDETGYGLIYGNVDQTYRHGDVFPAGYGGKVTIYQDFPELTQPFHGFQPAKDRVDVVPEVVTIPQVNPDLWAHYVLIKQVIIDKLNGVIRDKDGNELPIYIRPGLTFTYPEDLSQRIDIRGIISYYRGQPQLLVWDSDEIPIPIDCLQDFYGLENTGSAFQIRLIVIYQNGKNLYVKDLCGEYMLVYGNIGGQFVNGDTIECVVKWGVYQQQKQLIPIGDWRLIGHGPEVEPEEGMFIEELSQDMCYWYIRLKNVKFVTEGDNTYIEDEYDRLPMFNKFGIDIPVPGDPTVTPPRNPYDLNDDGEVNIADLNCLINMILSGTIDSDWTWIPQGDYEGTFDVTGFLTVYKNQLEFYPIEIVPSDSTIVIVGDLNQDNEVNIADINALIDRILGQ